MPAHRRTALTAGLLYLVTIVASIPALALKTPLLDGTTTTAAASQARLAVVLELLLAAACVGTAVVLHPLLRRCSEALSLGFVAARTVEAATIVVGVLAILGLVAQPQAPSAAGLVALHDAAFLVGPGLIPAVNALCLGTILYRTRLVPRAIPALGLVGAPILLASALATIAGSLDQVSTLAGLLALPIAAWELTLGLWLTAKGFRTDAIEQLADGPRLPAGGVDRGELHGDIA